MALDDELGQSLSVQFLRIYKLLHALRTTAPRYHESVEQTAYPLLHVVSEGPTRISDIAARVHTDASVVSRQASHLESLGLVAKSPDPEDRRANVVSLTPAGAELLERIMVGQGQLFARMVEDWHEGDVRAFDEQLERFVGSLERELRSRHPDCADAVAANAAAAGAARAAAKAEVES